MYGEMELNIIEDKKTILFIIIDDKITTFNFLATMMYSQHYKNMEKIQKSTF